MVIRLFCAAGMSTSLLVKKMEEAAKEKGKDADIAAYPFTDMERMIEGVDVALLGPQVGYQLARAKEICDPKGGSGRCDPNAGLWNVQWNECFEICI